MAEQNHEGRSKLCPLIKSHLPDCYYNLDSSQYVERIVNFCGSNYLNCKVYMKITVPADFIPEALKNEPKILRGEEEK